MKLTLLFYLLCLLLVSCSGNNSRKEAREHLISKQLQTLLDKGEYFKLESDLSFYKDSVDADDELYFQAFVNNSFNRNQEAMHDIDTLLKNAITSDSIKSKLYMLLSDCYFKTFQYSKAAHNDSVLIKRFYQFMDSSKVADIKNDLIRYDALKDIPPQKTEIHGNTIIKWVKDRIGLIEIPVKCKDQMYHGIFDTRANISSISKTYADKLGLKMLNVSYDEGSGITGIQFKTGLGIADSLYIGNILVRNAVFQVMPDSILYLAPIKFAINMIIGFPIIEQLKEIHIFKNGQMLIPKYQTKSALHNLALDQLDPVISLKTDEDSLCFYLDTGAGNSVLYASYFNKYQSKIIEHLHKKIIQFGGAGGVKKKETYVLDSLQLWLDNKKVTLDSVDILSQKIYPGEKFYGNLGQDFTSRFNEFVLNFGYMYVEDK
ncbi:MAG TPA: aspartyl protease family protein [Hanamia sp.]|nr:aspartyl protease family protein [Hanamia sp.]